MTTAPADPAAQADPWLVFLERASLRLDLVKFGEMTVEDAIMGLAAAFYELVQAERTKKQEEISKFLAERKEAGRKLDAKSADVEFTFSWTQVLDPYGVFDLLPEEQCLGRSYFAWSADSDGWISFSDLPEETRDALWRRIKAGELVDSFEKSFFKY